MPTASPLRLALALLALLQVVHLLDSLRTDAEASFPGVLTSPQAVLGVGGAVAAIVLDARRHRAARPIALTVASLVAAGFIVVHGLPFASERTEPYWGDGTADAFQWLGVSAIVATAAVVVTLARRPATVTVRPLPS